MELKLINVSYNGIKGINMSFKSGTITSIIGENIAEIITLVKYKQGQVKLGNKIIKTVKDVSKNIGYVFEFPEEQFFNNTVKEELLGGKKNEDKLDGVLETVSLDKSLLNRDPFTLSSGEKRKLAIASILIDDKDIIIFNEPTISLDSKSKDFIIKILRNLKNQGKIVIINSNDVELIHKVSDYIYVVDKTIVLEGKKYDVFKNVEVLKKIGIKIPKVIEFSNYVLNNKKIRLGYRDDINDLIKDIYRYVR